MEGRLNRFRTVRYNSEHPDYETMYLEYEKHLDPRTRLQLNHLNATYRQRMYGGVALAGIIRYLINEPLKSYKGWVRGGVTSLMFVVPWVLTHQTMKYRAHSIIDKDLNAKLEAYYEQPVSRELYNKYG